VSTNKNLRATPNLDATDYSAEFELDEVREELFRRALVPAAVAAVPVVIVAGINEWLQGRAWLSIVYGTGLALTAAVLLSSFMSHRTKALLLTILIFLIAVSDFYVFGPGGFGELYFLSTILFAMVFIGSRAAFVAAGASLLTILAFAVSDLTGLYTGMVRRPPGGYPLGRWMDEIVTLSWVMFTFTVALYLLIVRLSSNMKSLGKSVARLREEVDERERMADTLRESESRYGLLAERGSEIIWELDASLRVTYVSPAMESILGWKSDEILGRTAEEIVRASAPNSSDYLLQLPSLVTSLEEDRVGEVFLDDVWGNRHWFESRVVTVLDEQGQLLSLQGALRDVTQRKQVEQQLLHSQKMEAIGKLAGGIAHDFNNILQSIQGHAELADSQINRTSKATGNIREIGRATERASSLVSKLLTFSRMDSGEPMIVDLDRTAAEIQPMLQRMLGENHPLEITPGVRVPTVMADPSQIEQLLVNLCVNARDAMAEGGPIRVRTRRVEPDAMAAESLSDVRAGQLYALLEVEDEGEGMAPETVDRIFEPFYTTKESGSGTGLGLSIVYGIVQRCQGFMRVDSTPGEGTRMQVFLPGLHVAAPLPPEPKPAEGELRGRGETILVAEDEQAVREVASFTLESAGYRVIAAEDGEEAWRIYQERESEIDACLLDVVMPRMHGVTLLQRIREKNPNMPILFCSGYSDEHLRLDAGAAETPLLRKPYRRAELLEMVHEVLRSRAHSP